MSETFTLSECLPPDLPEIVELQNHLWQGGEKNLAYYHWKYRDNPYLDGRYSVLARDASGRVAGMAGVFGSPWECDGARFVLPCVTDTIVVPEHRNSPLFHRMLDEAARRLRAADSPWLLDFGDQGAIPAMLLRGWKMVGPWALSIHTRSGDPSRPGWADEPVRTGARSGVPISVVPGNDRTIAAMADVAVRIPDDGRVRVVRDFEYYAWRAANPLANYHYLVAGEEKPAGFLVGHRFVLDPDDGETPTSIVECEADDPDVKADLIDVAHDLLPGKWILTWAHDLPVEAQEVLARRGTEISEPTGRFDLDGPLPNLMLKHTGAVPRVPVPADLSDLANWDVRGITGRAWR
ncbi:GNAT family N-acetyltransferase [Lentzea sp.]|uniref:GNAT family N-acetyltransferase n=1 Tax=Lentzea sp. TaxID=56099 RepID=UPI002B63941F|nr:GNAT family N-acetyltransferase [Lentzea sp.]HUQ54075.1 GNAT family N-acetyltransferase [Lentzea sp.]